MHFSDCENWKSILKTSSFGDDEAVMMILEDHDRVVAEVLRIKALLNTDRAHTPLLKSLRELQSMSLSVNILKETDVEKSVEGLQEHCSKQIRDLAQNLLREWKNIKCAWYERTPISPSALASIDPSMDQDWGLAIPPLDDGAFSMMSQTSIMDISDKFFEGYDDGSDVKDCAGRRGQSLKQQSRPVSKGKQIKLLIEVLKPEVDSLPKLVEIFEDIPRETKFERTKRKLHESYEKIEKAKKRRQIQVIDFQSAPIQNLPNPRICLRSHRPKMTKV